MAKACKAGRVLSYKYGNLKIYALEKGPKLNILKFHVHVATLQMYRIWHIHSQFVCAIYQNDRQIPLYLTSDPQITHVTNARF